MTSEPARPDQLRNRIFDLIHHGAIRRRVHFRGPFHMSNLVVLEKKKQKLNAEC